MLASRLAAGQNAACQSAPICPAQGLCMISCNILDFSKFHTSALGMEKVQVKVPSMGEHLQRCTMTSSLHSIACNKLRHVMCRRQHHRGHHCRRAEEAGPGSG